MFYKFVLIHLFLLITKLKDNLIKKIKKVLIYYSEGRRMISKIYLSQKTSKHNF